MEDVYIVAYGRSAVGKGNKKGVFYGARPDDVAAEVLEGVINRINGRFKSEMIDDIIVGCAYPEGLQGQNIARNIALRAGLPVTVSGQTVNRFCASGLQAIATGANAIAAGQAEVIAAGGVELMSSTPIGGNEPTNNPYLQEYGPKVATPMGVTAENVAKKFNISAKEQNVFALESHYRAHQAQQKQRFDDEIIPVKVPVIKRTKTGLYNTEKVVVKDEGVRPTSTLETLNNLPTLFHVNGSVTAGNSSQISDGAGFVILMSKSAVEKNGVKPIARVVSYKVVGVDPEIMGIGPVYAIPEVLETAGLSLSDIDLIELNEAFAAQAIACIQKLGLDMAKTNVNGGAIALGHPLGATGAILTARLLAEMKKRRSARYGMVSMCIGNGMGAAAIFEYLGNE
ncbi:acetyl-CoA acetyltransferase [Enterococcus casseliflavus]|uniref:thiolase family protein n=1 Tax=Enterococcus casseliflavus TaxID=37734 RepID=UPI0008E0CA7C|nr:thiolase family protein [Enterococcus casseliflavus]GEB28729.1 acetyl-CoA acetyltransferase [Enterococcus casseliflavus]SFD46056.1 acetyl-CoA acyltransferase [Enterococcus casseliflavus]STP33471.1 acetyl-CoA acetyltransferase [Enterococcus casseliflavus]